MQQRFTEAIEALSRAIAILDRYGDTTGVMNARINLALTWLTWSMKGKERAGFIIWQLCLALKSARDLGEQHAQARIFLNLSAAYWSRCPACHAEAAREWSHRAADLAGTLGDRFLEAKALLGLGPAEVAMGNAVQAREHVERAAGILDEIGDSGEAEQARQILVGLGNLTVRPGAECPHRDAAGQAFHAWLEDLPHAVLRGDDDRLNEYIFDGLLVLPQAAMSQPPPPSTGEEPASETTPLSADESTALLQVRVTLDDDDARAVAESLGHVPLALGQAAAVIRRDQLTVADFLARLHAICSEKCSALSGSILLNVESVENRNKPASSVLETLAILAGDGVDRSLLYATVAESPGTDLNETLDLLVAASLVRPINDGVIAMHPVVQEAIRHRARTRGSLLAAATRVMQALRDELPRRTAPGASFMDALGFSKQIDAVWAAVEPELAEHEWSGLIDLLQLRAWQVNQAISILTSAELTPTEVSMVASAALGAGTALLDDSERLLGSAHRETHRARNNVAGVYSAVGDYNRACALLTHILRTTAPAEAHDPETLRVRHNLGFMHLQAGRVKRARQMLDRVLADRERILGTDHPDTRATRHLLELAEEKTL
jgi:tetratricopeptide (TPR) repeat protein